MATSGPTRPLSYEAFEAIIKYSQVPLFRYAYKLTGDQQLADEATQRAFIAAWHSQDKPPFAVSDDAADRCICQISSFEALDSGICSWLFAVVYRQAMSTLRSEYKHRRILARLSEEQPPIANAERMDLSNLEIENAALETALASLPPLTRDCFILRMVSHLTEEEVATSVNLTRQSVHGRIQYALKRVTKALRAAQVRAPKGVERP